MKYPIKIEAKPETELELAAKKLANVEENFAHTEQLLVERRIDLINARKEWDVLIRKILDAAKGK